MLRYNVVSRAKAISLEYLRVGTASHLECFEQSEALRLAFCQDTELSFGYHFWAFLFGSRSSSVMAVWCAWLHDMLLCWTNAYVLPYRS